MADFESRTTAGAGRGRSQADLRSSITAARHGVSVSEAIETMRAWSIPVARFAAILGCSERKWSRARAGALGVLLSPTETDRLCRTRRLFEHARTVFDHDADARAWLSTPNPAPVRRAAPCAAGHRCRCASRRRRPHPSRVRGVRLSGARLPPDLVAVRRHCLVRRRGPPRRRPMDTRRPAGRSRLGHGLARCA